MKLTRLTTAVLASAALLLTGCGSDEAPAAGSAGTPAAASAATTAEPTAASTETSSAAEETTAEEPTAEESGSMGEPVPTTTVGGDVSGGLDADSVAWFDAFCSGIGSTMNMDSMANQTSTDPADMQKAMAEALSTSGKAATDTAATLEGLPAPGFDGGADFATKSVAGLKELGQAFSTAAEKSAAGDQSALEEITKLSENGPMKDLAAIAASPEIKSAIAEIPSCKTLGMS